MENAKSQHPWWALSADVLNSIRVAQNELEKVWADDAVSKHDYSWKLKTKKFPYSCTDEEGLLIYFTITANNFKSAFEIATAFGYSTAYIGLAMKKTGGSCQTLDCYIEEFKESYLYNDHELYKHLALVKQSISYNKMPDGLSFAKTKIYELGLDKIVHFHIGLSPDDIPNILSDSKIDFALIDGGHFGEQPTKDFMAIYPYLAPKCAVLFHDNNYNPSVDAAVAEAEKRLKCKAIRTNSRYNLTLVGRGLSKDFIRLFESFPDRQFSPDDKKHYLKWRNEQKKWRNKQKIKNLLRRYEPLYAFLKNLNRIRK